jgi:hypothetical protein
MSLYLGKELDPATSALGAKVELDPSDLLTHALIVGMTGSGKTGLAIALIEEVLRSGVPVLAIDPKGDLGNLLLLFEDLAPASFTPWIDREAARRDGRTPEQAAEEAAAAWTRGLAEWGLGPSDVRALERGHDAVVFTPGSTAGVPLNVLQSLERPSVPFESAAEDLRDEISGIVSGLLGLLRIESDPLRSREHILLSNLIESGWREGRGLALEDLLGGVADPPFEKVGALPLESVYPRKERQQLVTALNNLLASPGFQTWRQGEPLDVERLLRAPDGRPRLSIVYTAHLQDEERMLVTALLLDKVKTWMRRQGGTTELRALVYMDEVFGYFPPHPANPPTKRPLLTLLKQARAQGVGVVLATQNPVDVDYKGLANMGTWLVGKLQTEQDRARLRDGLLGAGMEPGALERLLAATRKRVFLLHDVHRRGPVLLHSRWALSYLRGPLTRDEIELLMKGRTPAGTAGSAVPTASLKGAAGPPALPGGLEHYYLRKHGEALANPYLLVKYAVRYKGAGESVGLAAYRLDAPSAAELLEGEALALEEGAIGMSAPAGLRYAELPAWLLAGGVKALERTLKERLPDKLELSVLHDPVTQTTSEPGEDREAFAARVRAAGAGAKQARLREQLEKKRRDLKAREEDLSGRKQEKWMALGSAILSNIGLLTGRKRSISGAGSVLSKNRMENTAEARVEALKAEIAELESQLDAVAEVDPSRFEERRLVPTRSGVDLLRYGLLWVH